MNGMHVMHRRHILSTAKDWCTDAVLRTEDHFLNNLRFLILLLVQISLNLVLCLVELIHVGEYFGRHYAAEEQTLLHCLVYFITKYLPHAYKVLILEHITSIRHLWLLIKDLM